MDGWMDGSIDGWMDRSLLKLLYIFPKKTEQYLRDSSLLILYLIHYGIST